MSSDLVAAAQEAGDAPPPGPSTSDERLSVGLLILHRVDHMEQRFERVEDKVDTRCTALEGKMDARYTALEDTIHTRCTALEDKMDARFGTMDARFGTMDARFGTMDARYASLEDKMDTRFDTMDARFGTMDARYASLEDKMDTRFGGMEAQFGSVAARLVTVDERFMSIDAKIDSLRRELSVKFDEHSSRISWMFGLIFVAVIAKLFISHL